MMYVTAVSGVMVTAGISIRNDDDIPDFVKLLFAGGFLTTFFWVLYCYRVLASLVRDLHFSRTYILPPLNLLENGISKCIRAEEVRRRYP